ncbi:arginine ABC transporter permease [Gordoniibacillus kamchatkensis]|uniref:Arginine ABC transporter permease n=1 Tax=Gordoniibacillus kamchatkensis TaxID=1590651 RepID=A0ABR5ADK5_9BACL|nr:amino acid ABC transporter permease [Paenibacillus sp. VKM B-2647]KIL39035.1 arginine ABC transporter permease [Paenibacillus sp. VKM B-2647]
MDFGQISGDIPFLLNGILVTLEFTLLSAIAGFLWGIGLALIKISKFKPLAWFGIGYTSIFRGTPLLVQLYLVYFATPELTGYSIPALQAAVITFGLNSAAYISEVIRGGILAVDKGQREAAMSLGISKRGMMFDIVLPQALKHILPALVNESIALLKDSTLVSTIGVVDVLRRAQVIQSNTYLAFEPLILAAVIYYVIVMVLTTFARRLERRVRRSD